MRRNPENSSKIEPSCCEKKSVAYLTRACPSHTRMLESHPTCPHLRTSSVLVPNRTATVLNPLRIVQFCRFTLKKFLNKFSNSKFSGSSLFGFRLDPFGELLELRTRVVENLISGHCSLVAARNKMRDLLPWPAYQRLIVAPSVVAEEERDALLIQAIKESIFHPLFNGEHQHGNAIISSVRGIVVEGDGRRKS
ncbi:hypothetical protein H5410_005071 [Solanum commersonii]|uniref:Uncharacterized protein n=1 Tax=Solanum commersonii TaxID=4109 RepID=A0A9J6A5L8_SOLCO|nr:hypothetical protein H5410_005071 [Solanum commersonii]